MNLRMKLKFSFINSCIDIITDQVRREEENKAKATTPTPRDEMQPDRPKQQRGSDLIQPPPSAPPPRPHDDREKHGGSAWTKKASFWLKGSRGRRKTRKFGRGRSFSCPENMENNDSVEEFDYSSRRNMSKSSSSSASNGNSEALKMKGANYFSCGSWKGMKRDSCVFSKQI
ncbi:hypothetical protein F511_34356 [Dorcoceras hygrometricum]|uniref:Uncharacterized protein n=1 Tax=Dorcoceras hygrometricum TaxID=472368 RepID=A0A2Z7BN02_9LAMI|nr:hypothetical protein F511_34356 [Dorcoceras hygrometricum]